MASSAHGTSPEQVISRFRFARSWRHRNDVEDAIAEAIANSPETCFDVGIRELQSARADRRGAAAAMLGRLVEATRARFAPEITEALMDALERERSMRVAEELATALGRAWDASDARADLMTMARDDRPTFRLVAAQNLAFAADTSGHIAALRKLTDDADARVQWWARFGLEE